MSLSRRNFIKISTTAVAGFSTGIVSAGTNDNSEELLRKLAERIGPGIKELSFSIKLAKEELNAHSFNLKVDENTSDTIRFSGTAGNISIIWEFKPFNDGFWTSLSLQSSQPINCISVTPLWFIYKVPFGNRDQWLIPNVGENHYVKTGLIPLSKLDEESKTESILRGAFMGSKKPGVFVGTYLPQRIKHYYAVSPNKNDSIEFKCTSLFTAAQSRLKNLRSESTWVCAKKNLNKSLASYAGHVPYRETMQTPPVGWNSWDYYYNAIHSSDILENMAAIKADKILSEKIRYILIDGGWYEEIGEWYPNHRFPGGTLKMAKDIADNGFIPGIWTAPLLIGTLSPIVLRRPYMLIKNEYGDPQPLNGQFCLDPTHPESQEYLKELYTRLYSEGYRIFKIDFLDVILPAHGFHKSEMGCYEAIRELYSVIKPCIKASHLLAATSFPQCGPGILDSGRVSIDIHNQWNHLKWGMETIQLKSWMHKRLFYMDPDFLVVRGNGTSPEAETNVTDPVKNSPGHPRWRNGPIFNYTEAQTRASMIALSGGSVVLSDRITKLNKEGLELIYKVIDSTKVPALALDLGDEPIASLWYQDLGHEKRLTIINWEDSEASKTFSFADFGLIPPGYLKDFWENENITVKDGRITLTLRPHQSKVFTWV